MDCLVFVKVVRNTLINDLYYDFDLKNAQPEIIRLLCESNNFPCPIIKRYCNERPELLEGGSNHYGVDRDTAKGLFFVFVSLELMKVGVLKTRLRIKTIRVYYSVSKRIK